MGFLGSGKTTLIAALLKQPDMDNVGVIVNEFGAVGIDDVRDPTPLGIWVLEETRPVNWALLPQRLSVIIANHGDRLLSIKGLIYCVRDKRPIAIHGVQLVFHTPLRLERWVSPPKTTLIIIGDVGARPTSEGIAEALRSSVVEDGSATLDEVA